jgi:RNA polymerase sigma-70 factor (ECF subfamily)
MDSRSDAQLVHDCLAGDRTGWDEVVERFSRYVYAIATQAFRLPPDEAEDVFQEVFARLFTRLDTLRDPEALRPWIGQLTRRECINRLRGSARESPVDEIPEHAEESLDRIEEAFDVHAALATLSRDCRDVLDRFFCRDETYRTICADLGLPSGTIASRISRCLNRLREQLEGRNQLAAASSGRRDR